MAAYECLVISLLMFWIQPCSCQSQPPSKITLSQEKITLTQNTMATGTLVTVTCQPPSGVTGLVSLIIRKQAFGTTGSTVLASAAITVKGGVPELIDAMKNKNATVSGSTNEQRIILTMNQAKCEDEGTYICVATYTLQDGSTPGTSSSKDLTVEVTPGEITLTASNMPYGRTTWAVNDSLTLTCAGLVGSVNITESTPNPQITWIWQYKTPSSSYPGSSDSWMYYSPDSDISRNGFIPNSRYTCSNNKNQSSTLLRHLTLEDSGRTYRCFVQRGGQGFEEFAATYTVGTVTADGTTLEPEESSEPSKANVGAIVGGVIGSLIVIAVIVIVVYFLVIRPRRQEQQGEYTDGGDEKGGDKEVADPYPNSANPSVMYSVPSKRGRDRVTDKTKAAEEKEGGVINKALDESDEKRGAEEKTKVPPDDNDDRRHGRRPHKDKKQAPTPYDPQPAMQDDYDQLRDESVHRDQDRRDRPRRRDDDRHGDDRYGDDHRRGGGERRRPREGDDYGDRPAGYDNYGQGGRRNRAYESDNRRPHGGHQSSSDDGGMDHSQYSTGDGDPTIGTAI